MSPNGEFDRKAQIRSLGNFFLYKTNQGVLPMGESIDEQLAGLGIKDSDLDVVFLSHLDCDHVNGLRQVAGAKKILASNTEIRFATKGGLVNKNRYNPAWWEGTKLEGFDWNGTEGSAGKSYDIFGDGSFLMINIPGHTDGQCALKITNSEGRYVLLFADGGYAEKSWKEQIASGVASDRVAQKKSLAWIREMSISQDCVESLANHDTAVKPHIIEL